MRKVLFFFLPLMLVMGACTQPKPRKSQLEIRAMQTRSYETKDIKLVMKAVMHTLQDDNFLIKQANVDLGLLTAQKDVDLGGYSFVPMFRHRHSDIRVKNNAIIEASANISEFGDKTRVRINFQQKVLDNKGVIMTVKHIHNAGFYQKFFSKVDKAVFLGKENLQ